MLGLDFDKVKESWNGRHGELRDAPEGNGVHGRVAPVYMGAIHATRSMIISAATSPCVLLPSPGGIAAYRTDITWDDECQAWFSGALNR